MILVDPKTPYSEETPILSAEQQRPRATGKQRSDLSAPRQTSATSSSHDGTISELSYLANSLPSTHTHEHERPHTHGRRDDSAASSPTDPSFPLSRQSSHDDFVGDYSSLANNGRGLKSSAKLQRNGTIAVRLDLAKALPDLPAGHARAVKEFAIDEEGWKHVPKLSIVILIVGSRGDVQPYVALGKRLVKDGHRVRLATHETFRSFVLDHGLEFFDIGGNPQDLMSYMVKNPGLVPGIDSLIKGDIPRKRKMLKEMIHGCWNACHSQCPETGRSFIADAIISNPPAFAHIHCAEALGIPLQLTFTMPWCSTTAFPHPLVNVKASNAEEGLTNYLTYALADMMTWQGVGDIINKFRKQTLRLPSLSMRTGPGLVETLRVPWTYCMSPALVPKPRDWMNHIDVVGFYFLDLASGYTPPDDLAAFLADGPAPIYIGFGSVVVEDPESMTRIIFEATKEAGVRALVSAGWGGLGDTKIPSHVFILGNVPHDWLFAEDRVMAVIHHGGAGTTSIGLAHGLPTLIVPFFGDQGFWGSMIEKAGAGPKPLDPKQLSVKTLVHSIRYMRTGEAKRRAQWMGEQIRSENGVERGVESFYKHLPLTNMRCDLDPNQLAVWWAPEHYLKLGAFTAQALSNAKLIDINGLDVHRPKEYNSRKPVTDPITGSVAGMLWLLTQTSSGAAELITSPVHGVIRLTTAIPRACWKIVDNVSEGMHNVPKLYGSPVRRPGEVKDIGSGLLEGGKSFAYGMYDGVVGLVKEPWDGAKKDGTLGALKGSARSLVDLGVKPVAGMLGLVSHPFNGILKTLKTGTGAIEGKQRLSRIGQGFEAFKDSEPSARAHIVHQFHEARKTRDERKATLLALAREELLAETERPSSSSASTEHRRAWSPLRSRSHSRDTLHRVPSGRPPSYQSSAGRHSRLQRERTRSPASSESEDTPSVAGGEWDPRILWDETGSPNTLSESPRHPALPGTRSRSHSQISRWSRGTPSDSIPSNHWPDTPSSKGDTQVNSHAEYTKQ
ncbi:glycosyltransferase family 1 protein [Cylindrobasidium torrendii FP15055 ss-10]|uniref:Glycosyltransferase family 1 protein n=1 Tax=Cylindrobasidium torrendii FP15055 ss-10 TaxID=1314674 RepID=A0A0D7BL42_9AGAR|nr:glycosyltransferase family 1 protein [Cylindrobasidium torrendii FP15055 ss-10]